MPKSFKYFLVWIIPGLLLLIGLTYIVVPMRMFQTDDEYIQFVDEYLDGIEATAAYAHILSRNSTNTRIHFHFANAWDKSNRKQRVFLADELKQEGILPSDIFQRSIDREEPKVRNAGYFGKACLEFFNDHPNSAMALLDSIDSDSLDGVAYLKGRILLKLNKSDKACDYFNQEIIRGGMIGEAWKFAIRCKGSLSLISSEKMQEVASSAGIPNYFNRYFHYSRGSFGGYFRAVSREWLGCFHFPGVIVAFIILVFWSFYLVQLNRLANVRFSAQLIALIGGAISVLFVFIIGDLFQITLGVGYENSLFGTLLRAIFDIGLIEEASKMLLIILVIWIFRKSELSPASIIALASMVGLGFTFSEDSSYFDSKSLDIITSRSLIAGCLHMAWSSIAIYGYVQVKYRLSKRGRYWLIPAYFLLAVALHGLYDYWLIESVLYRLRFLSIIISAFSIVLWVTIYTNALNNSNSYFNRDTLNISKLNVQLMVLFSGVVYLEYLVNALIYGPNLAMDVVAQSFETALIAIPVLAFSLSRIDIAPGGWISLDILINRYIQLYRELFNHEFMLSPFNRFECDVSLFPESGTFVKRVTIFEDNTWYFFENGQPQSKQKYILIQAKTQGANLVKGKSLVHVRLVPTDIDLNRIDFDIKEFKFLGWGVLEPK